MAGRPRKPAQLKKAQGTFQKSRNPENEPEFSKLSLIPKPPEYLNKHGKAIWGKLLLELNKSGILTEADLPAFEMLCMNYGVWRETSELISKKPECIENEYGGRSVTVQQNNAAFNMCEKMMSRFGLTPSDRNRLGLSKKNDVDPNTQKMRGLIGA